MAKERIIDSHNSLLTNREMAILSSQIDGLAIAAAQTMRYSDISGYFNAVEHYYFKMACIINEEDLKDIEGLRKAHSDLEALMERNPACRNRKSLALLLKITKEFYFKMRYALQRVNYYFRTSEFSRKGLSEIQFYDDPSDGDDDDDQGND